MSVIEFIPMYVGLLFILIYQDYFRSVEISRIKSLLEKIENNLKK